MRVRGTIGALERRLKVERAEAGTDPVWAGAVRGFVAGFITGEVPPDLPDPPRASVPDDDWRAALQGWACGVAWFTRALALTEFLPGMTTGAVAVANVVARSRWQWWQRAVKLEAYASDPVPWFVPLTEPVVSSPAPRAAALLPDVREVLSWQLPNVPGADADAVLRWRAGGMNPLPHVSYTSPHLCAILIDDEPAPSTRHIGHEFPETLPHGQTAPGWFW